MEYLYAHHKTNEPFDKFVHDNRDDPGLYAVLEGDWGGQIYATIPLKDVIGDLRVLYAVLVYLDVLAWDCNEGDGRRLYIVRAGPVDYVGGGMGGGACFGKLWMHPEFPAAVVNAVRTWFTTGEPPEKLPCKADMPEFGDAPDSPFRDDLIGYCVN